MIQSLSDDLEALAARLACTLRDLDVLLRHEGRDPDGGLSRDGLHLHARLDGIARQVEEAHALLQRLVLHDRGEPVAEGEEPWPR